jgi:hypothetical protein
MSHVTRTSVDLNDHPELVVIYLGMRVRTPRGMRSLRSIAKEIEHAATLGGTVGLLIPIGIVALLLVLGGCVFSRQAARIAEDL